jgi:hypothetical protein
MVIDPTSFTMGTVDKSQLRGALHGESNEEARSPVENSFALCLGSTRNPGARRSRFLNKRAP